MYVDTPSLVSQKISENSSTLKSTKVKIKSRLVKGGFLCHFLFFSDSSLQFHFLKGCGDHCIFPNDQLPGIDVVEQSEVTGNNFF